jgi:hypothetical protein
MTWREESAGQPHAKFAKVALATAAKLASYFASFALFA